MTTTSQQQCFAHSYPGIECDLYHDLELPLHGQWCFLCDDHGVFGYTSSREEALALLAAHVFSASEADDYDGCSPHIYTMVLDGEAITATWSNSPYGPELTVQGPLRFVQRG